jgi:hypothetical protein
MFYFMHFMQIMYIGNYTEMLNSQTSNLQNISPPNPHLASGIDALQRITGRFIILYRHYINFIWVILIANERVTKKKKYVTKMDQQLS